MTSIKIVVRDDLDDLFALQVRPEQRNYVAPNPISIAEFAYVTGGYVFSIRSDDKIVGLMGIIDFQEHEELEDGDDPGAAFLMRMMVADRHQGRGVGKAAMLLAFDWARARGNTCFQTGVVPGNDNAMRFYEAVGLRKTGRMVEGEIEMSLRLLVKSDGPIETSASSSIADIGGRTDAASCPNVGLAEAVRR